MSPRARHASGRALGTGRRLAAACAAAWAAASSLASCAPLLGARPLADARAGETTFHRLRAGGRERSFLLHLPPAERVRHPVPLLLAFHGYQANASVLEHDSGLDAVADRHGWAVAYVNGTGGLPFASLAFNAVTCCGTAPDRGVDEVALARAIVDTLAATGVADRARVYAAGFSNGGMLALRLACQEQPLVAGVADVAGAMPDTACAGARGLPVLLVRGARDDELRADHRELRRRDGRRFAASFRGAQRYWARRNGCAPGLARDSSAALVELAALGCPAGLDVRQLVVAGQGHAWPGGRRPWLFAPAPSRAVNASERIVAFFEQEARAGAGRE